MEEDFLGDRSDAHSLQSHNPSPTKKEHSNNSSNQKAAFNFFFHKTNPVVAFFLSPETWSVVIPLTLFLVGYFVQFKYVIASGIFGMVGALVNILTTRLLFQRIPGWGGSGGNGMPLMERHHREIRATVREVVMTVFFNRAYIEEYLLSRTHLITSNIAIESTVRSFLDSQEVTEVLERKMASMSRRPEMLYLSMIGVPPSSLKSWARLVCLSLSTELTPLLEASVRPVVTNAVTSLYDELEQLVSAKLSSLSPSDIAQIVEPVVRPHLRWYAVCGAAFGSIIGVLTEFGRVW